MAFFHHHGSSATTNSSVEWSPHFCYFFFVKPPLIHSPLISFPNSGNESVNLLFFSQMTMYHPDRVGKEKHGLKYFVLMEEIAKTLSKIYNEMKIL